MSFEEFKPLNEKSLVDYIKATPALSSRIGDKYEELVIKEVGDGNLNVSLFQLKLCFRSSLRSLKVLKTPVMKQA
ncbi:unnamed protein product [Microthlaspi erraticum]|uniref:Uncharacterized protein n=1 Tax=Microthlaspi erraticum TaxID=1685480 RepID=A0A6D2L1M1_9BRAS|nr:unnamed protein product [Microthlaspi erraticum]